jgi:hypothetical protein
MMPSAAAEGQGAEGTTMDERPSEDHPDEPTTATPPEGVPSGPSGPGAPVDWQAATTAPRTSGVSRLIYGVLAVVVAILVVLILTIVRGASSNDPYDAATREIGQKLLAMPEFKARYGDITSDERAYQIGQEIALKGIPRLSDAQLLRYWQLTNKVIGVADPAICGRIFRQTAGPEDAKNAARALDLASFRELLDVTMLAFQADLRGDPVRPAPSSEALTTAFLALQVSMGPGMADAAAKLTDKSASDADVCTAGRAFLGAVLALGEPDRTVITRFMISSAAGS